MDTGAQRDWIYWLQVASVAWIWVFVVGISVWILHLIRVAVRLNDAPGASVAISLVAIPVFFTVAGVLTYVFVGLQRGRRAPDDRSSDRGVQP